MAYVVSRSKSRIVRTSRVGEQTFAWMKDAPADEPEDVEDLVPVRRTRTGRRHVSTKQRKQQGEGARPFSIWS